LETDFDRWNKERNLADVGRKKSSDTRARGVSQRERKGGRGALAYGPSGLLG
jgi:hypothetical protein